MQLEQPLALGNCQRRRRGISLVIAGAEVQLALAAETVAPHGRAAPAWLWTCSRLCCSPRRHLCWRLRRRRRQRQRRRWRQRWRWRQRTLPAPRLPLPWRALIWARPPLVFKRGHHSMQFSNENHFRTLPKLSLLRCAVATSNVGSRRILNKTARWCVFYHFKRDINKQEILSHFVKFCFYFGSTYLAFFIQVCL